jgi:hypothetical protein
VKIDQKGRRMRQVKIGLTKEMITEIAEVAKAAGISFSDEARQRLAAFREDHRLVEIKQWIPKSQLEKPS